MVNITAITTSQLPRNDFLDDLVPLLPDNFSLKMVGALDCLSVDDIKTNFLPKEGEETLVVRLKNGEVVEFPREKELPIIQDAITRSVEDGADAIIMLCTLPFPNFKCPVPFISPYTEMHSLIPAIAYDMKIGMLFPYESHAPAQERTWRELGLDICPKCLAPAKATGQGIANLFMDDNINMLVLDCIGYTAPVRDDVQKMLGIPVIHAKQLIISLLKVLF